MVKALIVSIVFLAATPVLAECTRYCNPEKSKPCGKSCISKDFTCHKPVTTACSGTRPDSKGKKSSQNQWLGGSEAETHISKLIGLE